MRKTRRDYSGLVFGNLSVVGLNEDQTLQKRRGMWDLICVCGATVLKSSSDIAKLGQTSSCGCYRKPRPVRQELHLVLRPNKTAMPEYENWESMRQRCNNPRYSNYQEYGGRGITIDPSWDDFWQFYADLGERPQGCTLDRRDVDKSLS